MTEPSRPSTDPIRAALSACRGHLVHAAMFSAFLNILYLAPSLYMLQVYDRVVPTQGVATLAILTAIFTGAVVTLSALDYLRSRLLIRASARLDRLIAGPLLNALLRGPARGPRSGAALRDFDQLRQTITGAAILAVFDAPWSPIYILVCFLLHPALGALACVGCVLLLALSWANERATRGPLKDANVASARSYQAIEETLASAGLVEALGMREALVARHLDQRATGLSLQARASFAGATYVALIKALRLLLGSLALGLGAWLVVEGKMSGGAIFAASLLITRALAPIEQISGAWKAFVQVQGAYTSLVSLFAEQGERRPTTALPAPQGAITVEGVRVAGPGGTSILSNINLRLEPGEMLGIVGASGAGKSTLAAVLAGAITPARGVVRLDGANLADWPEEQLREAIGYAPQMPQLFRGTVKQNISRFAAPDAFVDARTVAAAQACGAHDFILSLPAGYETELGAGGTGLSVGQVQRLALARALYHQPRVLILDEPNASLDPPGEQRLDATIALLRQRGVTVVVVAHRTAILARADKLLVLAEGQVARFGRPEPATPALDARPQAA